MCHHSECGCEQQVRPAPYHGSRHSGGCCCCVPGHGRRFRTREEMVEELEGYMDQLKAESKAVEERIAELKKHG